jgi:hypothetical protein
MSYEENESQGNESANGAGNRFDGLDASYKAGGSPRAASKELQESMLAVREFFSTSGGGSILSEDIGTLDLVREMKALKDAKEAADAVAKEINRRWDYVRLALVPTRFEDEGLTNAKLAGVGRISLRGELYASILPGKKEAAFEWLDDNGRGDLVQKAVNSSSLKASMKKMLMDGEEIPEDIFKVTPYTMATITKA